MLVQVAILQVYFSDVKETVHTWALHVFPRESCAIIMFAFYQFSLHSKTALAAEMASKHKWCVIVTR